MGNSTIGGQVPAGEAALLKRVAAVEERVRELASQRSLIASGTGQLIDPVPIRQSVNSVPIGPPHSVVEVDVPVPDPSFTQAVVIVTADWRAYRAAASSSSDSLTLQLYMTAKDGSQSGPASIFQTFPNNNGPGYLSQTYTYLVTDLSAGQIVLGAIGGASGSWDANSGMVNLNGLAVFLR